MFEEISFFLFTISFHLGIYHHFFYLPLQANLWISTMNELRNGVKLKKTNHTKTPIEYALTPYEMLMDDIRSRRYKLNKVSKVLNISRFVVIPLNYRLQNDIFHGYLALLNLVAIFQITYLIITFSDIMQFSDSLFWSPQVTISQVFLWKFGSQEYNLFSKRCDFHLELIPICFIGDGR